MLDFSVEGGRQMFDGPFFEGRDKILILGKALKFVVIFQKFALKLLNIRKITEKISEKCKFFKIIFIFCAVLGKIKIIICT